MASVSRELPVCSRLLAEDEVAHYLRLASLWARTADSETDALATTDPGPDAGPLASEARRQSMVEAARHREFLWSVIPGDNVWLTADPSSHPEAGYGVPCLVVVRDGTVILRYRLAGDSGPEWGSPILPSSKRLTRDQVIAIASEWVRARYPTVPAVAHVWEFSEEMLDSLCHSTGHRYPAVARAELTSQWIVGFATSQDTAGSDISTVLRVVVDDVTGQARLNC